MTLISAVMLKRKKKDMYFKIGRCFNKLPTVEYKLFIIDVNITPSFMHAFTYLVPNIHLDAW